MQSAGQRRTSTRIRAKRRRGSITETPPAARGSKQSAAARTAAAGRATARSGQAGTRRSGASRKSNKATDSPPSKIVRVGSSPGGKGKAPATRRATRRSAAAGTTNVKAAPLGDASNTCEIADAGRASPRYEQDDSENQMVQTRVRVVRARAPRAATATVARPVAAAAPPSFTALEAAQTQTKSESKL